MDTVIYEDSCIQKALSNPLKNLLIKRTNLGFSARQEGGRKLVERAKLSEALSELAYGKDIDVVGPVEIDVLINILWENYPKVEVFQIRLGPSVQNRFEVSWYLDVSMGDNRLKRVHGSTLAMALKAAIRLG